MIALLSALNMSFKNIALQKNVSEAFKILQDVKREFASHDEVLAKLRAKLSDCGKIVDDVETRTNVMRRRLKMVETADVGNPA